MKRNIVFRRLLRNPIVIVVPLVLLLGVAWRHYTYDGRNLSLPTPHLNLLADVLTGGKLMSGSSAGWQLARSGNASYKLSTVHGYVSDNAAKVVVSKYVDGDVTFTSPKMSVRTGDTYLFKSYYTASKPFAFLVRYFYTDKTSELTYLQTYSAEKSSWSTVSHAFKADDRLSAVQFVYRLTAPGSLTLDGAYMEPKQEVYIPPKPPAGHSAIPNSALAAHKNGNNMPDQWSPYQAGNNEATFSYLHDNQGKYVQTGISNYHDGEAKWEYSPVAVKPHQYYRFSLGYRGNVTAPIVAEYTLKNGTRQFDTIANAPPAGQWTTASYFVEIPDEATTLALTMPLQRNGTLASRDYSLVNISKSGKPTWNRPLVSITFDDGWQSSYDNALPLLNRYGFKGTFYVNPSSIETPNFMTAEELAKLRDSGHEIAAHGYSHDDMTTISSSRIDFQLHEGRDYLKQAGFPTEDFAVPYGNQDAEVQLYARKYYKTLRTTDTGVNTKQNFDPYSLKVLYLENSTKLDSLEAALSDVRQSNGWLVLVYHRIGPAHTLLATLKVESATIATDTVRSEINAVHESGITVLPISAAYKEIHEQ